MAKEIERKFLVKDDSYKKLCDEQFRIVQGYLSTDIDAVVRVRIKGYSAFLTVKSRNKGMVRNEWEYEIPVSDAKEMLLLCKPSTIIEKTRYCCGPWEIDEFSGRHSGLVVAEIELSGVNDDISFPDFIGEEITGDPRYYNSTIANS